MTKSQGPKVYYKSKSETDHLYKIILRDHQGQLLKVITRLLNNLFIPPDHMTLNNPPGAYKKRTT